MQTKEDPLTTWVSHSPLFWWIPLKQQPLKLVILKKKKKSIVTQTVLVACQNWEHRNPLQRWESQHAFQSLIKVQPGSLQKNRLYNHLRVYNRPYAFQYLRHHTVLYYIKGQREAACTVLWQNGSIEQSREHHVVKLHPCTVRNFTSLDTFNMKGFCAVLLLIIDLG